MKKTPLKKFRGVFSFCGKYGTAKRKPRIYHVFKEAKFLKHGTGHINVDLYHVILRILDVIQKADMVWENKSLVCTMDSRGGFEFRSSFVACGHGTEEQNLCLYHALKFF